MSTRWSAGKVRQIYRFIEDHKREYTVQAMCRVLEVAPSGYYEWLQCADHAIGHEMTLGCCA